MMELKQTKDVCVDKLTAIEGKELQITANITSTIQIQAVMQGYVSSQLNSKFGAGESELLMRLSNSYRGRCRDDLTAIGKVADIQGWRGTDSE